MKKISLFSITILILLILHYPTSLNAATDSEATSSADPALSTIKENVKKRIESVVKGQQTTANQKTAIIGTLSSLANDTLTIQTENGVQLASVSTLTEYIDQKSSKSITLDDIGISDYLAVLGYETESGVLDARRLILASEPEINYAAALGFPSEIDLKDKTFELTTIKDSKTISFTLTKNSYLHANLKSETQEIGLSQLSPDIPVLIIYKQDSTKTNQTVLELLTQEVVASTSSTPTPDNQ